MSNNTKIYGFEPVQWEALPDWLKTFITESHDRNAHAHHAEHRLAAQSTEDQAWKTADFALKSMITIEGGSLVAILAFLGSLIQNRADLDVVPLLAALGGLGVSLFLALIAAFMAYFTAADFGAAHHRRELSFVQPFVRETSTSARFWRRGEIFRWIGIGCAVSSMLAAVFGVGAFGVFTRNALSSEPSPAVAAAVREAIPDASVRSKPAPVVTASPPA